MTLSGHVSEIEILKVLWTKLDDGRWGISDMKGLKLRPKKLSEDDHFGFEDQMELVAQTPPKDIHQAFSSFGPTSFLLKQSIVPVVALAFREQVMRCIGTAFLISCTGYLITACHVLFDPLDRGYGRTSTTPTATELTGDVELGVIIPTSPAYGVKGIRFFPFERWWCWGSWEESPLIHEPPRFNQITDVALCKIPEPPNSVPHQPLNLSLNTFAVGEEAYVVGYPNMKDVPIEGDVDQFSIGNFSHELRVSLGQVVRLFPANHLEKELPTPGPCFEIKTRTFGGMSGAPIFGARGGVVRGVMSRSFSGEKRSYGSMLDPLFHAPLEGGKTLKDMMDSGNEGIAQVIGAGM